MRFKKWLMERFLPLWAKETVYSENKRLTEENLRLRAKVEKLNAYITGMEGGMKAIRRVVVNVGGKNDKSE